MELFKVLLTFVNLGEERFDAKAELIVTSLTTEPMVTLLPDPIPVDYPQRPAMTTGLTNYKAARVASADGSKSAIKERIKQRALLEQMLKDFAPYVELKAKSGNNIQILTKSGYDLRRVPMRSLVNGVPSGPTITVKRGKVTGSAIVCVKPVLRHVASWEAEFALGETTANANFTGRIPSAKGSRIVFTGLEVAKLHQFRARGIGSNGPGDWSDPVGIIVT